MKAAPLVNNSSSCCGWQPGAFHTNPARRKSLTLEIEIELQVDTAIEMGLEMGMNGHRDRYRDGMGWDGMGWDQFNAKNGFRRSWKQ